jgi:hypothetical protein
MGVLVEVDTVSMAVTGLDPLIVTDEGLKEQLGAGVPPPVMLQERLTLPVYPSAGVRVMVDVDALPALTDPGFSALALSM